MSLKEDPFARLVIYDTSDPAFEWPSDPDEAAAARGRFQLEPWNLELATVTEGRRPIAFHVRRLSLSELTRFVRGNLFEDESLAVEAFRLGCEKVEAVTETLEPTDKERPRKDDPRAAMSWANRVCDVIGYRATVGAGLSIAILSRLPVKDIAPLRSRAG